MTMALFCVALGLVVGVVVNQVFSKLLFGEDQYSLGKEVCTTPGCIQAANTILQNMDSTVDPCHDFYKYSCGGFNKKVRIPDDDFDISPFKLTQDKVLDQLRDILEANYTAAAAVEEDHDNPREVDEAFRMAQNQYKACMDLDRLESLGLKPFADLLDGFGGWPVLQGASWDEAKFRWEDTIYQFRKQGFNTAYEYGYLFSLKISADSKNSSYRSIHFGEPWFHIDREYLVKGIYEENVRRYYDYMQQVAVLFGADSERAAVEMRDALLFEMKLADITLPREMRRDANKFYNPLKLREMEGIAPVIDWTKYVNNVLTEDVAQVDGDERVIVSTPDYFRKLNRLLADEPKRNVANYLIWRAAQVSLSYLNKRARGIAEDYTRNVTGKPAKTPRWRHCIYVTQFGFRAALGKMYVLKHFKEDAKQAMVQMVQYIKDEFRNILNDVDWMDDNTKSRAHAKLNAIKDYIAYPDELLDDTKVREVYQGLDDVTKDDFFKNKKRIDTWNVDRKWMKLREKVDKTDWKRHAFPYVVNAYYDAVENSIQFPAGILQGIFYDKNRPNYLNFGGIGIIVGHEITHGFDDQGRRYDDEGNLADWWEPETEERFVNKTKCIIYQYGNYTVKEVHMNLNGVNTQGENIADNGGIKEAYRGYNRWVEDHGEEQMLPGLDLKPNQLFWVSAANVWCQKSRPKMMEHHITTGSHSPGQFRVKGPFSNFKDFVRDFKCPLGSPMNPVEKCQVW